MLKGVSQFLCNQVRWGLSPILLCNLVRWGLSPILKKENLKLFNNVPLALPNQSP